MRLEDFEPAQPGRGEVLVRVRAAAVNPMDAGIRGGRLQIMTGRKFPRALGHDFPGVVEAIGEGVTRVRVGDEVLGGASIKGAGAFAEMVLAEEKGIAKKPANISWEEGAALPTPAVTAYQALVNKGKLKAGQSVFVAAALGRSAVQLALMMGASVGGSCRGTVVQEAHDLGVSPIVEFDFDPAKLAGRFDVVLDASGKLPLNRRRRW
ncbi:NAD(P)-dependent alcohol dehydrogenase [Micromonospora sp. NPDC005173]|uniref:NAD(P)-dependent alcohol dehydrogenase n=1 Tax=Micromonospora sp. NPDC005173 TaxID=3157165 RepID=UPI0033BFAA0F